MFKVKQKKKRKIKKLIIYSSLQDSEHIGDVYQDEFNQAALLLYRDKTDDALLMVSFQKNKIPPLRNFDTCPSRVLLLSSLSVTKFQRVPLEILGKFNGNIVHTPTNIGLRCMI